MKHSIFQPSAVRHRGDYEQINIDGFINFLEDLGYSPVVNKNQGNYKEQGYQFKTVIRNTAYHGQFRLNFLKRGSNVGLVVFSSNDCQLPFMLFAGPVFEQDVIPMVEILSVKHIKSEIDKVNAEVLISHIFAAVSQAKSLINSWSNTEVTLKTIINSFQATNEYKASLMKCLKMRSQNCKTKLELFQALISSFIYGQGTSETGRKVKVLKHLRRHIQMSEFITNVVG